jgi:hypothetical protein
MSRDARRALGSTGVGAPCKPRSMQGAHDRIGQGRAPPLGAGGALGFRSPPIS